MDIKKASLSSFQVQQINEHCPHCSRNFASLKIHLNNSKKCKQREEKGRVHNTVKEKCLHCSQNVSSIKKHLTRSRKCQNREQNHPQLNMSHPQLESCKVCKRNCNNFNLTRF